MILVFRGVLIKSCLWVVSAKMFNFYKFKNAAYRIFANGRSDQSDYSVYPAKIVVEEPNQTTIDFIKLKRCRSVAEIGVYEGHTSLEIAKYLNNEGELHLYDFEDRVCAVERKIRSAGFSNVKSFGCSYKFLDSYNWPLGKVIESNSRPIYDYVFLDGAHTWAVDALTVFLADRLLKVGGFLDFDDYDWWLGGSLALSPKAFPFTARQYTAEQIATQQVKMIVDLIVRRDDRYIEVLENKVFQKVR